MPYRRKKQIMSNPEIPLFDLLVVGGGINGCGIAADAAGRGLSVLLAEENDLAGATSSASSKLIHGGLRYLEHYEFRLVREALGEREVLLDKAPHMIWPLRFVLPHMPGLRPKWMLRSGLFLYDHLHRRARIPGSTSVDLRKDPAGQPLKAEFSSGFDYWDCWVDDARLVLANAMAARDAGARILTRTKAIGFRSENGLWHATLRARDGTEEQVRARALVNAAGPWVADVDRASGAGTGEHNKASVRLVKGSHLVVPRIPGADSAYILQSPDKRVVFVLPFEERFTIIGTTDVPYDGDPRNVVCTPEEDAYLRDLVGRFFKSPVAASDVLWRYSGVRPLYDDASADPSAVTRDYVLTLTHTTDRAPRLSVYGGKITTYRCLAEDALAKLLPEVSGIAPRGPWTAKTPLPGGDLPDGDFEKFHASLVAKYPAFDPLHLRRLARRHGTRIAAVMGDAKSPADMGEDFGDGLFGCEVAYMKQHEWAVAPDDILFRRTKLGVHHLATRTADERARLAERLARSL